MLPVEQIQAADLSSKLLQQEWGTLILVFFFFFSHEVAKVC